MKFEEKQLLVERQRIHQRTIYDLEMIKEVGYCKGIENYSRHFSGRLPGEAHVEPLASSDGEVGDAQPSQIGHGHRRLPLALPLWLPQVGAQTLRRLLGG